MKNIKDLVYGVIALGWCIMLAFPVWEYASNWNNFPELWGWSNSFNMVVLVITWGITAAAVVVMLPDTIRWISNALKR